MFNPLGLFNPTAQLNEAIIAKSKAFVQLLPSLPAGDYIIRGYFHWTVAPMNCDFGDYDAEDDITSGHWDEKITGHIIANAAGDQTNESMHTYQRNSHAFGVALAGMDGATESNFGPDPVTLTGLEYLCATAGAVSKKYNIDITGTVSTLNPNEPTWMTHAEAALVDGYFGERWDLASFVPFSDGATLAKDGPSTAKVCGNALRQRAHLYKLALG